MYVCDLIDPQLAPFLCSGCYCCCRST